MNVPSVFLRRRGVVASFGCGGAADLVGLLGWASKHWGRHSATTLELRGCDVVPDWFDLGDEAIACAVERSPWTEGITYWFAPVPTTPSDADLSMFEDADVVIFSWVLALLAQQGSLEDLWRRIIDRLRPGAIVVIADRWEPAGFNGVLRNLTEATPRVTSAWGVGDFDQVLMDYTFSDEVRRHGPRGKYRASGVVARVN